MARHSRSPSPVVCFGEALWDVLPQGIFLGGAPLNVAYHLSRLSVPAIPISAVGRDFLGAEVRRRVASWDVETRLIAEHPRAPTGTVSVTLDRSGGAAYEIVSRVAWDHIDATPATRGLRAPAAIVFGSLALRSVTNRRTLRTLLTAWPAALRVVDLNLRVPFDRGTGVDFALRHAQVLKLNHDELGQMTGLRCGSPRQLEVAARRFAVAQEIDRICVTAGPLGAGLLWAGQWHWEPGRPVKVRDTIGAGDAFLASFLHAHVIRRDSPPHALRAACRLGEFVAGKDGATPFYRTDARGRPADS